jgi:hypothetical protein
MSKTPEEMAEAWMKYEFPEGGECCQISFLAGYTIARLESAKEIMHLQMQLSEADRKIVKMESER